MNKHDHSAERLILSDQDLRIRITPDVVQR